MVVAYRAHLSSSDRGSAIALVIGIHLLLLFVFLHLSGRMGTQAQQGAMQVLDLKVDAPPPPAEIPQQPTQKRKVGASGPANLKSEATPVEAPSPRIDLPSPPQIVASPVPSAGAEPTQGASQVLGPGTAAGGAGSGRGGGGSGNGSGNEQDGIAEPPHLVTPVLKSHDFERSVLEQWPSRATVFLKLRVDPRGNVSECAIDRGTGVPAIDSIVCNVVHERLKFRPAVNREGQAVAGWFGYAQRAPR
jgi:periplasmic protein TonB